MIKFTIISSKGEDLIINETATECAFWNNHGTDVFPFIRLDIVNFATVKEIIILTRIPIFMRILPA
jgi:hypothetical protein